MNFLNINLGKLSLCFLIIHLNLLAAVKKPEVLTSNFIKERQEYIRCNYPWFNIDVVKPDFTKNCQDYINFNHPLFNTYEPFHQDAINERCKQRQNLALKDLENEMAFKNKHELLMNRYEELMKESEKNDVVDKINKIVARFDLLDQEFRTAQDVIQLQRTRLFDLDDKIKQYETAKRAESLAMAKTSNFLSSAISLEGLKNVADLDLPNSARREKDEERTRIFAQQSPDQTKFYENFMKEREEYINNNHRRFNDYEPSARRAVNIHFMDKYELGLQDLENEKRFQDSYELLMNRCDALLKKHEAVVAKDNNLITEDMRKKLKLEKDDVADKINDAIAKIKILDQEFKSLQEKIQSKRTRLKFLDEKIVQDENLARFHSALLMSRDPELLKLSSSLQKDFFKILKSALIEKSQILGNVTADQDTFNWKKTNFLRNLNSSK
jgi:hypothetical protein